MSILIDNIKNLYGWRTRRKIVVISVDDYGNVRLASSSARKKLDNAGLKVFSRFDAFDALENTEDLEMLYEALQSVCDKYGRHAVFTPFALAKNIDYERIIENGYSTYFSEELTETYQKLSNIDPHSYGTTWKLWEQGIKEKLMLPQFHGREHLNLKVFEEKLRRKDKELMVNLENRSYTSISNTGYPTISFTAAFDFDQFVENKSFSTIISEGMDSFEKVFGYRSVHFNSPGGRENSIIHNDLKEAGIKYIDANLIKKEHQGGGRYETIFNYTGKVNKLGQILLVRNVVFEPTNGTINHVAKAMQQIEAAFRFNRPAIISSHRVNFCGHIDANNRAKGISDLKALLKAIVKKWPDVEFMAANELGDLIAGKRE